MVILCFGIEKFDETSISENTIKKMLLDKDGNMWMGAYRNGLNQYIEKQAGIKNLEMGDVNTGWELTTGVSSSIILRQRRLRL